MTRLSSTVHWSALIDEVIFTSTMPESTLHGVQHWRSVAAMGLKIAREVGCNPKVAMAFGLIHDSQRHNDDRDPEHGRRAAESLGRLRSLRKVLTEAEVGLLAMACRDHDKGMVAEIRDIGCCWDSDRFNLLRIGVEPDARFFSVTAPGDVFGRMSAEARNLLRAPPSWAELVVEIKGFEMSP